MIEIQSESPNLYYGLINLETEKHLIIPVRSYRSTDQRQEFLNCFLNNHGKKDNIILESVTKQYNHLRIALALKELKNPCRAGLLTCHDFNSIKSKSNQYLHLSDEEALSKPHQAADERLYGILTH